jgi:hypothetical protein
MGRQNRNGHCDVDGCTRPIVGRRMCSLHYQRWRNHGTIEPARLPRPEHCTIAGCSKPVTARRVCGMHYKRWQTYGNYKLPERVQAVCCVADCEEPVKARGWCIKHYSRWQNWGTVKDPEPVQVKHGTPGGYTNHGCRCDACKEAAKTASRNLRLWKRFRLRPEAYDALLAKQHGRCAICERRPKTFHVDHDHACCPGEHTCGYCVRGLLCRACNWACGALKDNPEMARRLADYLSV